VSSFDPSLIESFRRYEDPRAGIGEEFVRPQIGGARTVGVLSRPLGAGSDLGFVVCPSFGPEHTQLNGLEVVVARALSAAGFSVLRYHGQGYADSDGPREAIRVASHLADAADAVGVLADQPGVHRVGVIGGLFGGTVAALTAERLRLPAAGLWEPATDGNRYAERLLRNLALRELAEGRDTGGGKAPLTILREQLASGGVDIRGFLFTKRAFDELSAIDLIGSLSSFDGESLVLGISKSGRPGPTVEALAAHLNGLGGSTTLKVVRDRLTRPFGTYRFVGFPDRPGRSDTQFAMNDEIARTTVAWAQSIMIRSGAAQ